MKNKDGFISMTLVYTFLIVFMFIMLAIINSYTQKNHFLETINEKIDEDLKNYMGIDVNIFNKLLNDNAVLSASGIDLSSQTTKGLYYLDNVDENDDGNSNRIYFFRGKVTNNFIVVNNKCFRIMRTNENGSIRLIYYNDNTDCSGNAKSISKSNYDYTNNKYIWYSEEDGLFSSEIKKVIDDWYKNTMYDNVNNIVSDSIYCNGEQPSNENLFSCQIPLTLHASSGGSSESSISLKYAAALPSYTDLVLAGTIVQDSYLNFQKDYWLMTYKNAEDEETSLSTDVYYYDNGINIDSILEKHEVFPVISLKSTVDIIGGNGSQTNPYKVE